MVTCGTLPHLHLQSCLHHQSSVVTGHSVAKIWRTLGLCSSAGRAAPCVQRPCLFSCHHWKNKQSLRALILLHSHLNVTPCKVKYLNLANDLRFRGRSLNLFLLALFESILLAILFFWIIIICRVYIAWQQEFIHAEVFQFPNNTVQLFNRWLKLTSVCTVGKFSRSITLFYDSNTSLSVKVLIKKCD